MMTFNLWCYCLVSLLVIFLSTLDLSVLGENDSVLCPEPLRLVAEENCDRIQCSSPLEPADCPEWTWFKPHLTMCGCCPGCAKYQNEGDSCNPDPNYVPIRKYDPECLSHPCSVLMDECAPYFPCDEKERTCVLLPKDHVDTKKCNYKLALRLQNEEPRYLHWHPHCTEEGKYEPKQCKGDANARCFCYDEDGNRIFGEAWIENSENQTCACSRMAHEMRARNGLTATLRCSSDGNFEPLQCDTDSGMCYCVDPKTGKLTGGLTPQNMWQTLSCVAKNQSTALIDEMYYNMCDSQWAAVSLAKLDASSHGTDFQVDYFNCGFDGSFNRIQIDGTNTNCTFKNGARIGDYFKGIDDQMTCNCAWDTISYSEAGKPFSYNCELQTGNYEIAQIVGTKATCLDVDGYPYGPLVDSDEICCLINDCPDFGICSSNLTCYDFVT